MVEILRVETEPGYRSESVSESLESGESGGSLSQDAWWSVTVEQYRRQCAKV